MKKISLPLVLLAAALILSSCASNNSKPLEKALVTRGSIVAGIPSTGIVMPRNRLEIKPPVAGRIEQVLVKEGESVSRGQTLAWMSSSDRAALLDAARSKGQEEVKYWEDVYKPTPIIAPLSGFIIQRSVEPGQSVTTADPILVMADKLIVKAQVDETDIGKIKVGQKVNIELDAFQGQIIPGYVEHIAYESEVINNVNIYKVDVLAASVPSFFRSGMSANVTFTLSEKKGALLLPLNAFKKVSSRSYVFVLDKKTGKTASLQITTGLENSDHVEIISGLKEGDEVLIPTAKMIESISNDHRPGPMNPFQKKDN
jgi:macrolide-specific efflux system membrane fusion protein